MVSNTPKTAVRAAAEKVPSFEAESKKGATAKHEGKVTGAKHAARVEHHASMAAHHLAKMAHHAAKMQGVKK